MLRALKDPEIWKQFQEYKIAGDHMDRRTETELKEIVESRSYVPIVDGILAGESFPPPRKSEISKRRSDKKRVVYIYPKIENWVLKLLTYLLQRKYDGIFADNLYSFRPKRSAHDAVRRLTRRRDLREQWCYKADIRNYFNSVPVEKLLPLLKETLRDEAEVYAFIEGLLTNPYVKAKGDLIQEDKGIMAGVPISAFLANLYLSHVDHYFREQGTVYIRYSDDIILFCPSKEELDLAIAKLHDFLTQAGLAMNPDKEIYTPPGGMWTFLGFSYDNGTVDVAPVSVEKLKAKMRRKARALIRWQAKKGTTGPQAAKAFIRVFNRKLFNNTSEHELSWCLWYFPMINTDRSLKVIDHYCQSCIRYIATGKRNKSAYNFRYEDMKAIGYMSLVNQYYKEPEESSESPENPT